ncbi:MAG: 2-amino-4-hydroxy-6-hydroxymethyldihydropteridine diphosphokinase [Candidatus Eremiobacteraeota bacterium]|nr:2-amino-4-hydroxy-6-hydroxymethyldihydropteridine diphosphokinase [Candidatus Eremiobacteraeota bacterium]
MTIAAIGVGSNQGDAQANVIAALDALQQVGEVTAISQLYRTRPWGVTDQPDFINAAALVRTTLLPRELLQRLQSLEAELGRQRTYRWGPRVIDLDILYFGDQQINEPDLIVPHPRLAERQFVLMPLADIDPRYRDLVRSGYAARPGECTPLMPEENDDITARVRRLIDTFEQTDLIALRISGSNGDAIELCRSNADGSRAEGDAAADSSQGACERAPVDVIKANLVGIAHLVKPVVTAGAQLDGERELAYVEALGIRNPIVARGPGRLAAVLIEDGQPVEYGQPLFEITRA